MRSIFSLSGKVTTFSIFVWTAFFYLHAVFITISCLLFQVNGGDGYKGGHSGGGGAGGRMAIYYSKYAFAGSLLSRGGYGIREYGAAGTSYLVQRSNGSDSYGVLKIDNNNRKPSTKRINQVSSKSVPVRHRSCC